MSHLRFGAPCQHQKFLWIELHIFTSRLCSGEQFLQPTEVKPLILSLTLEAAKQVMWSSIVDPWSHGVLLNPGTCRNDVSHLGHSLQRKRAAAAAPRGRLKFIFPNIFDETQRLN